MSNWSVLPAEGGQQFRFTALVLRNELFNICRNC